MWLGGQAALAINGLLVAGTGLALGPRHGLGPALALAAGSAFAFAVPAAVALLVPETRRRTWFWLAACVPAALWVPALPWVSLRVGLALASPAGLVLTSIALVAAVMVIVGGILEAVGVGRQG